MPDVKTIEDVYELAGGFGYFQLFAIISIIYAEIPAGFLGMLPVFVATNPESWRCLEDGAWKPINSTDQELSNCLAHGVLDGGNNTIVAEWHLVGQYKWVADFITSIQMAGALCGGLFGSQIADMFGRKKPMYLACFLMMVASAASGFTTSPYVYAAARFIVGASISSYLIITAIYPMEFVTPKWRILSGGVGLWGEGVMLLALIAYYVHPWRELTWITAMPMSLTFISFPFLPESPRWLLRKGRVEEAKKAFNQIARWNGCPPIEDIYIKQLAGEVEEQSDEKKIGLAHFFRNRILRVKILVFMTAWFTVSLIYYGISFNTKNLSGSQYLNMAFQGSIDSVGFPSAIFAIAWFGRQKAFMYYMIIASSMMVGIVLMEINIGIPYNESWATAMSLFGKFFVAGGWSAMKCFTAESFPTSIRSRGIGFCTVAAALGGVFAPQMAFLGSIYRPVPYFIFGGFAVISTGLSLLLIETAGKPLEENIEVEK